MLRLIGICFVVFLGRLVLGHVLGHVLYQIAFVLFSLPISWLDILTVALFLLLYRSSK